MKSELRVLYWLLGLFLVYEFLPSALTNTVITIIPSSGGMYAVMERPQSLYEFVLFKLAAGTGVILMLISLVDCFKVIYQTKIKKIEVKKDE